MKRITFVFKEDGSVSTDANGFSGNECIRETEKLLKTLDTKLVTRKLKAEAHAKTRTKDIATIQE